MRVTYTLSVVPEGRHNALVPRFGVLFRRRLIGELASTSWEWCVRSCLPESIRHSSRCRVVVLDGECAVESAQSRHRLSACVPGWKLLTGQDPARTPSCVGHLGHVAHACSHLRPLLWRSVSLFDWPDTQLPAAKRGSELRGSKILVYIGASVQLSRFVKRRGWG